MNLNSWNFLIPEACGSRSQRTSFHWLSSFPLIQYSLFKAIFLSSGNLIKVRSLEIILHSRLEWELLHQLRLLNVILICRGSRLERRRLGYVCHFFADIIFVDGWNFSIDQVLPFLRHLWHLLLNEKAFFLRLMSLLLLYIERWVWLQRTAVRTHGWRPRGLLILKLTLVNIGLFGRIPELEARSLFVFIIFLFETVLIISWCIPFR
jgi:hypothetical protein